MFLATKNEENSSIRGGEYKAGIQYQKEFPNKLQLNAGASFQLESKLSITNTQHLYSLSIGSVGNEVPRDTLSSSSGKSNFNIPLKTSLGIGLGKENKWYAGINYEFQDALSNTSNLDVNSFTYENSNKFSLGGFYLPKINSISSYWERITYRAGLRFENTGLLVDGTGTGNNFNSINDFGINLGLGLPFGNKTSNINLGFEYGKRGTTNNNLVEENYFNVRLSLSLNDLWFQKRRID